MSEPIIDRWLRRQNWLDGVAEVIQGAVGGLFGILGRPGRGLKNLLHGTVPLHHPLHPAVTDVPIGAWLVAIVADFAAHYTDRVPTEAGDLALAVGLAAAVIAVLSGYTDFHETVGHERRLAVTHGLTMTLVFALEAVSLALRWWGGQSAHPLAVGLATAGVILLLGGAYLGGHLVFCLGTMVNHNAFAEGPEDYVPIGAPDDFKEGELHRAMAGALPVLVVRRGGTLHAIGAVCSHAGGPLDEGELDGDIVVCPWHGSRFCLKSGRAVGGPATFDEPLMGIRVEGSVVAVRPLVPLH